MLGYAQLLFTRTRTHTETAPQNQHFTPYALARTASGRTVCHPERSEGSGRTVHILDEWAVGRTNGQTFTSPPPYRLVLNRCSFLNHGCAATCSCYRLTPDPLSTTFPSGKIAERGANLAQPNPSFLALTLTLTSPRCPNPKPFRSNGPGVKSNPEPAASRRRAQNPENRDLRRQKPFHTKPTPFGVCPPPNDQFNPKPDSVNSENSAQEFNPNPDSGNSANPENSDSDNNEPPVNIQFPNLPGRNRP